MSSSCEPAHAIRLRQIRLLAALALVTLLAAGAPKCGAAIPSADGGRPAASSEFDSSAESPKLSGDPQHEITAQESSDANQNNSPEASQQESAEASTQNNIFAAMRDLPLSMQELPVFAVRSERPSGAAPSTRCVLVAQTFCGALRNRPVLVLGSVQTAALVSDGITTRQFLKNGYVEIDPLTRLLIGRKPTWARMAPLGAVQVFAGMWLAERMAESRHRWVRRLWWLPQIVGISGNIAGTANNLRLQ